MKTLTAVLLAGGESRRMGRDKATLMLDGEPLWSRQLRTLRELQPDKILISARTRPAWCPPEIESVLDQSPSHGPLSGLTAALKRIQTTHLLALAVDLPQMTSAHLNELWSLARMGIGVVPRNGRFFEPLCAIYPVEGVNGVEQGLVAANFSLQSVIKTLATRRQLEFYTINRSERFFYRNVNTMLQFSESSCPPC